MQYIITNKNPGRLTTFVLIVIINLGLGLGKWLWTEDHHRIDISIILAMLAVSVHQTVVIVTF